MNNRGFTILELMIAVLVLTILLSVAVPSFQSSIKNSQLAAISNDFVTAVHYARSEAVKTRKNVHLKSISGTKDWTSGWRVETEDGVLMRMFDEQKAGVSINANNEFQFVYNEMGIVNVTETLMVCAQDVAFDRVISILPSGFVRVSNGTC